MSEYDDNQKEPAPPKVGPHGTDIFKGGPNVKYIGGGKIDTSEWFNTKHVILDGEVENRIDVGELEKQIKDQDIWFCAAPFQMFYTSTKGELAPCSWADEALAPNIRKMGLKEYFQHDETLNRMRLEMITPGSDLHTCKWVCANCRVQESTYGRSRRQASMKIQTNDPGIWPGIADSVRKFKETGIGDISNRIFEMQVKAFGNKCNLDCYMCIPFDSSTRLNTMRKDDFADDEIFHDSMKFDIEVLKDEPLERIIGEIADLAPYIYNLKLIGGEPLVMKKFFKLLQAIVDTGHAKDMMVKYQTNMASFDIARSERLMEMIPEFRHFEFTVSLDGYGKYNDYIRRRSNFDEIVNNIDTVNKFGNVSVNVNGTISFLSVLRFYELIDWVKENKEKFQMFNWSNIRGPAKLCANVLPKPIKESLIPKYEGFPDIQNVLKESNHGHDYQETFRYLLKMDRNYSKTKWAANLFDVYPELKEYYIGDDLHKKLDEQGLL